MKVMTVVGARPNFMKAAPIVAAIAKKNCEVSSLTECGHRASPIIRQFLLHTGQHYDQLMSDSFFADLDLPKPDVHLGVGSGSHAVQTAEIMKQFEEVLLREKPDVLIVVGDVNSTVACALVAAKSSWDTRGSRPIIAHVEAGLRSGDRTMPEEINRILTDQLSDLLFVTEESGLRNLAREGVPAEKVHFVGNTMIDSLLKYKEQAEASTILTDLGLRRGVSKGGSDGAVVPFALLTLHRPANVDSRDGFLNILEGLKDLAAEWPIIFPAHPRTQKRIKELGIETLFASKHLDQENCGVAGIHTLEPLGYLNFLCLMKNASLVVTDSGGIQEETTCLRVPCVTVRENTERPVTLTHGTNLLAGVTREGIREAVKRQLGRTFADEMPEHWDGLSAHKIVAVIATTFRSRHTIQVELEA
jgi:UDP-N-acetylglucosamine 2-epimerase (non-hydrolysing)